MTPTPWLVENATPGPARRRLVCVPYAGGGAGLFEPWRRALPGTAISAVRPPGRENRFREPPLTSVGAILDQLAPTVAARVEGDAGLPWAVFGYSLGALLAYELVARLAQTGGPVPAVLMVGGAEAPHVPRHLPDVSWLPDDEFAGEIARLGGTPIEVLEHAELLALMLPMIRADFRILETHAPRPGAPLPCPVVTYRAADDRDVRREGVARWAELTSSTATHHDLPGGHFVISEQPDDLLRIVAADLDHHLGPDPVESIG